MRTRLGTNQYKKKYQVRTRAILLTAPIAFTLWFLWNFKRQLWITFIFLTVLYSAYTTFPFFAEAPKAQAEIAQPNNVVIKQTSEHEQIVEYINQVFGSDAPKAIKVFTCESGLNPRAYNDNTSWGGVGHDLGVAQINDHYQGVTNADFLYNYHINILMAKQIFDKWGHNFHAWTCGKKLGL